MAKKFTNYQYVFGEMSERDKQEQGSKFWNKGKFDNFVRPFLPEDCSELTFIDIGCNHGIFLKEAEEMGFKKVIGVEADGKVVKKAKEWKEMNGGKYIIKKLFMEHCLSELPMADYIVMANVHYYLNIKHWLDFVRELENKTRYVILVLAEKNNRNVSKPSSDVSNIRENFKNWEEIGLIEPSLEGDPFPRKLWGICFKNPLLERVPIDKLDCGNHMQDGFYKELDEGKDPFETKYYRDTKRYRQGKIRRWTDNVCQEYVADKANVYFDIRKNGIKNPIIVKKEIKPDRIADGNHRHCMLKHLEEKSVIVRKIL